MIKYPKYELPNQPKAVTADVVKRRDAASPDRTFAATASVVGHNYTTFGILSVV
ncbi:hypothetical protein [uncultured Roseobacter sp.]|uniref:hypothetical protein n=1 Tax=uncultured Roseobacter sp. TaxID=114847 RepID=UPI0026302D44|nr:hypothetical protein [uncultured Roseobacter sp.]